MTPIDYTSPYTGRQLQNVYTYMGWQLITDSTSEQYRLRAAAGQTFDSEGFGKIDGRYVIACTDPHWNGGLFGTIGDYVDFELANGTVLHCCVGDEKNHEDRAWIPIGHITDEDSPQTGTAVSVIEFVVDTSTWYGSPMHANPGTPTCHPEWAGQLKGWQKVGSFWNGGQTAGGDQGDGSVSGLSYIESTGNDNLLVHFANGNPLLCSRANTIWLPKSSTNAPSDPLDTPTGTWSRANEALRWCQSNTGIWEYNQAFYTNGIRRGPALAAGTGCDCSGFVGKMLYNFAPNVYRWAVSQGYFQVENMPDTYALWNAFKTVWDSSTSNQAYPTDVRPGDLAFTSTNWYAGESFPYTYGGTHIRHVLMFMPDSTWWDMVRTPGPSNQNYGAVQTTRHVWETGLNVRNSTRSCVCRPDWNVR